MNELIDVFIPALSVAIGFWLKRQPWYETGFIPIASLVVSIVVRLGAGLIPPASGSSDAAAAAVYAISWGSVGAFLLEVLRRALVDALIATGAHSAPKNILQAVRRRELMSL